MNIEFIALIIVIILFWFFNIKEQDILQVQMPIENMKNISIFDGNNIK